MSGNRWEQPGVPHKGWHCVDVVDLRADGESADETNYATCQMCGNEKIRYVHVMEHPDLDENFDVGCVCAEKMSGDYEGPKRRGNPDLDRHARLLSQSRPTRSPSWRNGASGPGTSHAVSSRGSPCSTAITSVSSPGHA